jgi:hypothetical protein
VRAQTCPGALFFRRASFSSVILSELINVYLNHQVPLHIYIEDVREMANSGRLRRRKPPMLCKALVEAHLQFAETITCDHKEPEPEGLHTALHLHKCMTHTARRTKVSSWALTIGEVLSTIAAMLQLVATDSMGLVK